MSKKAGPVQSEAPKDHPEIEPNRTNAVPVQIRVNGITSLSCSLDQKLSSAYIIQLLRSVASHIRHSVLGPEANSKVVHSVHL